MMELYVTCPRGIEDLLCEELKELGLEARPGFAGVYVQDEGDVVFRINYLSRLAGRVLQPLSRFQVFDERSLYQMAGKIDWGPYFGPELTFAIDANVQHPKLRNSLYAAQVMKDAICDQLRRKRGFRPDVDVKNPDIQLNLFIDRGFAVISFDTSGMPLFKRGYRRATVEAPLQETLAAAILRRVGYDGTKSLCDPCCGSGTFLIEAAMIATNTPAGYYRTRWGFFQLPNFSLEKWKAWKKEWDQKRQPLYTRLLGIDLNIRACRRNVQAAGFDVGLFERSFEKYRGESFDYVVTNPPYGRRVEGEVDLQPFIDKFCKDKGYLFQEEEQSEKATLLVKNGGIRCGLYACR